MDIIIGISIGGVVGLLFLLVTRPSASRDFAAQDRDRALAKLFEARAEQMNVASLRERAAWEQDRAEAAKLRREQFCNEVREEEDTP